MFKKEAGRTETTETIIDQSLTALKKASAKVVDLGSEGLETARKNQFGETALRADIEAEEAVIDTFRKLGLPVRFVSEEHGIIDIVSQPEFLGVLDGLDGSDAYKNTKGKGRFGTMLGIFSNLDPFYGDYLFSGIIEPGSKTLYYAVKNRGCHYEKSGGIISPAHTIDTRLIDDKTRIYFTEKEARELWNVDIRPFVRALEGCTWTRIGSTASHYADLATGKVDLVLEWTRKGNLEPAAACGLVFESGGCMLTENGEDLRAKKYFEFGQNEHLPVISAATTNLAQNFLKRLKGNG